MISLQGSLALTHWPRPQSAFSAVGRHREIRVDWIKRDIDENEGSGYLKLRTSEYLPAEDHLSIYLGLSYNV